jgi:hypothetical protein
MLDSHICKKFGVGMLKDGVAVELNVKPMEHLSQLGDVLCCSIDEIIAGAGRGFLGRVVKYTLGQDHIEVPKKYQDNPGFTEIGCTTDKDAFSEQEIRPPVSIEEMGSLRFAGGHVHIGCDPWPDWLPKKAFVQFLAAYWGRAFSPSKTPREKFYGIPGIWRETPYGVEYRTPNTLWMGGDYIPYLMQIDESIKRILTTKNDDAISELAKVYHSGDLLNARYSFDKKDYSGFNVNLLGVRKKIDNALSGRRSTAKPPRLQLEGYSRESEAGAIQAIGIDAAPEGDRLAQLLEAAAPANNRRDGDLWAGMGLDAPPLIGHVTRLNSLPDLFNWAMGNIPMDQFDDFARVVYTGRRAGVYHNFTSQHDGDRRYHFMMRTDGYLATVHFPDGRRRDFPLPEMLRAEAADVEQWIAEPEGDEDGE